MQGDRRSHGLWELTAGSPPATAALTTEVSCDVAIVGAGYTGASAALHLARAGKHVVVLEAAEIGFGASGRNSGLVNAGMWVMPNDLVGVLGPTYGRRLIDLLADAPADVFGLIREFGIDCEADRRGTYHCAVGQSGLRQIRERTRQWQDLGAAVEFLDAGRTARQTGVDIYPGSLFDPRAGTIQPLAYARGLASAAMKEGATIHTGSPVVGYDREGADWSVRTAQGRVRSEWLILATDAYSTGPAGHVQRQQVRMPYFHVATPPLGENVRRTILPDGGAAWNTKTVLSHFRLDKAGRLIVGSIGALKGAGLPVHRSWARRHLARLFPQLPEIDFETEWYGLIGMTPDHLPRLHAFGDKAIGFAGFNGRGIAPGTVFGRELARLVCGDITLEGMPLLVRPVEAPSLVPLREAYYEVGARVAHLPMSPL